MTLPLGTLSPNAQRQARARVLAVNALVVVGIVVSVGLIIVSAILNFRMGYRSADDAFDGWVYGLGGGLGDCLKAMAPFAMSWGWSHKERLAAVAAFAVFVVFTAYSLTAALGFSAQHRVSKAAINIGHIERRGDLRRDLKRAEDRLEQIGVVRGEGEVKGAIAVVFARPAGNGRRTVGEISTKCTVARPSTMQACGEVAVLAEELARSEEHARLQVAVAAVHEELKGLNESSAASSADPQVDALKRLGLWLTVTVATEDVQFALALLMALFIELGSGVGLFVVTTPWRVRESEGEKAPETAPPIKNGKQWSRAFKVRKAEAIGVKLGSVDVYALERLEPKAGAEAREPEIFADYQVWCRWRGDVPHSRDEFARLFGDLAKAVGMDRDLRGKVNIYRDVMFVGR